MARLPPLLLTLLTLLGACVTASLGARLPPGAHHVARRQAAPRGQNITKDCLRCICEARHCNYDAGCQDDACGAYQITEIYFKHSNVTREVDTYRDRTFKSCATDFQCAAATVRLYMRGLATDCDEDGHITCDDMMMTHYYGITGCIGAQRWVDFTNDWKRYKKCANSPS